MSEPKDDDGHLDVVLTESTCPHCVIVEMMRTLIEDRALTAKEAVDCTYSALAELMALMPADERVSYITEVRSSLTTAVGRAARANRTAAERGVPAGCTQH